MVSTEWDPLEDTKAQYKSVVNALLDLEEGEQSFVIDSNGARRAVTKADYQCLSQRESRLLARLNKLTGRSASNLYAKD